MTLFIDLRATPSGGICAGDASVWDDGEKPVAEWEFAERIRGLDIVLVTHGFNVDRHNGVKSLSRWSNLCSLPASSLFIGVLWPGDSRFFPVMDYPFEGDEALASGRLLANFLNRQADGAASVSLVSHSLGARVILEALGNLNRKIRFLALMAGAIEDDCLVNEYRGAAEKAEEIFVLSSKEDWVLEFAFPIGNMIGEIVMRGHPYFKTALGRDGPSQPIPPQQQGGAWQIPDSWDFGHGDYYPDARPQKSMPPPIDAPGKETDTPQPGFAGWKSAWSAAAMSTKMR